MTSKIRPSITDTTLEQALELWYTVPKRWPSDRDWAVLARAEQLHLPFGDIELAVSAWGVGSPVVLVHGWGGHRGQFSAFVDPLVEAGYRVVAFDGPAHGDTPGAQTTGFEIAQALEAVVTHFGAPHAVLAHSFGSLVTAIALQNGLQARRLVFFGALRRLSDALAVFARQAGFTPEIRDQVYTRMIETFGADIWDVTALDKQLPKFDIPALLFHDRDDEITPVMSSLALAKVWPTAEPVTTQGLGHRGILQDVKVIERALAFLGD